MVIVYVELEDTMAKIDCAELNEHPFLSDMLVLSNVKGITESSYPFFVPSHMVLPKKAIRYYFVGEHVPPVPSPPKEESKDVVNTPKPKKKRKYVRSGKYAKKK